MNTETIGVFAKITAAIMLLWLWFGVVLPYCTQVTNTVSMAVGTVFTIFVTSILGLWALRLTWRNRKQ